VQLQVIAVGTKMPAWVDTACADYLKRVPRELGIKLTTIPVARSNSRVSAEQLKLQEWTLISKKIPNGSLSIALDERGKQWSSLEWSQQLDGWKTDYQALNFIIGGPQGLADECRQVCAQTLALGRMTMPHGLARIVLIEQIYRASTLLSGHPYHRE
jgi:23S rRNA (pseudouridine1915-N3)-methyltransferase